MCFDLEAWRLLKSGVPYPSFPPPKLCRPLTLGLEGGREGERTSRLPRLDIGGGLSDSVVALDGDTLCEISGAGGGADMFRATPLSDATEDVLRSDETDGLRESVIMLVLLFCRVDEMVVFVGNGKAGRKRKEGPLYAVLFSSSSLLFPPPFSVQKQTEGVW